MIEFNLLPSENLQQQQSKKAFKLAILVFVSCIVFLGLSFVGLTFATKYFEDKLTLGLDYEQQLKSQVGSQKAIILELANLRQKAVSIEKIKKIQVDMPQMLMAVKELMSYGAEIKDLNLLETGNVNLTVRLKDFKSLDDTLSFLVGATQKKSSIHQVTINGLKQSGGATNYEMEISGRFNLPSGAQPIP